MDPLNLAPFFVGQNVIAVDAHPGSSIKNGQQYIVTSCDYVPVGNQSSNGIWVWYVGVTGSHNRLRPSIFAPFEEVFQSISLEQVISIETEFIGVN